MTTAYWMVMIAALLPYVAVGIAKARPDYDNRAPRPQLDANSGWRSRAHWAHLNSFEAFAPFAAAAIIAHLARAPQSKVDALAVAFVLLRVAYLALYLADRATLRSLAWTAAFACVVGLFLAAAGIL